MLSELFILTKKKWNDKILERDNYDISEISKKLWMKQFLKIRDANKKRLQNKKLIITADVPKQFLCRSTTVSYCPVGFLDHL